MNNPQEIKKLCARLNIMGLAALGAVFLIFASAFSAGDQSAAVAFALVTSLVLLYQLDQLLPAQAAIAEVQPAMRKFSAREILVEPSPIAAFA